MSIANVIRAMNESAKTIHGADISILVARAVHFGNDDNLLVIRGNNHRLAALDFVRVTPGATTEVEFHPAVTWPDGVEFPAHTTSLVRF